MCETKPYALHSGAGSGDFNRKLKKALGDVEASDDIYTLELPSYNKKSVLREHHRFSTLPAHESFAKHVEDRRLGENLIDYLKTAPRAYVEHLVVREAEEAEHGLPVPLAIYLDGVPYSHIDSVIGFWMVFMLTGVRVCMAVLRKKLVCKCGCKGWCTYYPIFRWLGWSLKAIAKRFFPEFDDLEQEFPEGSNRRNRYERIITKESASISYLGS